MSQPTWKEIADAVQSTIATASGLTTIWRYQNAPAPTVDYVGISFGALQTVDVDFVDEQYDSTLPDGQQVSLSVGGVRVLPLTIEVWSGSTVEKIASTTALSILDSIITKLRLPSNRRALASVGLTVFDPGPANWVPSIVSIGFRGRATCDLRCRIPARTVTEYTDWIGSIAGTAQIAGMGSHDHSVAFSTSAHDCRMFWGVAPIPSSYDATFIQGLTDSATATTRQRTIVFDQGQQQYNGQGQPIGFQWYAWVALPASIDGTDADYVLEGLGFEAGMDIVATFDRDEGGTPVSYHLRRSEHANLGTWTLDIV